MAASTEPKRSMRSCAPFIADAGRAGDVVDGIAFQGEQVGHLDRVARP